MLHVFPVTGASILKVTGVGVFVIVGVPSLTVPPTARVPLVRFPSESQPGVPVICKFVNIVGVTVGTPIVALTVSLTFKLEAQSIKGPT